MVAEVFKSAKTQISERIASPLIGSFVFSWCLWNYKFFVILFSKASVSLTFELIDSVVFPTTRSLVMNGVLLPALTAVIYIFGYPYPSKFVYEFTRRRQKDINEIRQRIEDETPLTIEESRKIRSEAVQVEKKYQEIVDRLNAELSRLKGELANLEMKPSPESADYEVHSIPLESTQLALLRLLEKRGGRAEERQLIGSNQQSKVKTEFDLGELERMELVNKYHDQDGDNIYQFTHEGRRILLKSSDGQA